jgi:transcriptional regulator with XRE-family HTH domain
VSTLGERLSAVRGHRGLTQGEVARRIGLPQQAISRLERGEWHHVRSDVLARLAIALDVSADVLLGLRNIPTSEAAPSATGPREDTPKMQPPAKRQRSRKATAGA